MTISHQLRAAAKNYLPTLTSVAFFASNSIGGSTTITVPAGVIAGDLIVMFDRCGNPTTIPAAVVPTGFTQISNLSLNSTTDYRVVVSYKVADGTEGGTTITGIAATGFRQKSLAVFRPNGKATVSLSPAVGGQILDGNPTAQTVSSNGQAGPLIVFGCYGSSGAIDPRAFTPTKTGEVAQSNTMYLAYGIYNTTTVGNDVIIDMDDEGNGNTLVSFYLKFTPVLPAVSYITVLDNTANQTTYTYTAASIGTASADRYVVVGAIGWSGSTADRTVSSLTIGGVSATALQNPLTAITNAIFGLTVAAGTTADIVVTYSGSVTFSRIYIYTVTGLNSTTPIDSDSVGVSGTTVNTLTLTTAPNAAIISVGTGGIATTSITGWTNLTQNHSALIESNPTSAASGVANGTILDTSFTTSASGSMRQTAVVLR